MWAGGDCVSKGYIQNDELNEERYKPDPFLGGARKMFRTRDLGRWTSQGELEHFGRTDDQVKIRGFRVELDSVSRVIESIHFCKQAVTLKLDSRNLAAFVRPKSVSKDEVLRAVKEALPYYCVPSVIIALDEFPMTARGKIDKRALTIMAVEAQESVKRGSDASLASGVAL
jgi:acyl-coenzyme A synthetase/AMP-(fatty) acid ligase